MSMCRRSAKPLTALHRAGRASSKSHLQSVAPRCVKGEQCCCDQVVPYGETAVESVVLHSIVIQDIACDGVVASDDVVASDGVVASNDLVASDSPFLMYSLSLSTVLVVG